jgi:hypothetical protein
LPSTREIEWCQPTHDADERRHRSCQTVMTRSASCARAIWA